MQIIHGRNTGDGQMFSDLLHYRRVAYLQEHPVIEMNTLYGNARWQIFAVCVRDTRDEDRFNLGEEIIKIVFKTDTVWMKNDVCE
jgi:hypothetical protein